MRAAIIEGTGKMSLIEAPTPEAGPGEVVVRVRAVGICGSDVHGFKGQSGKRRQPGLIMGHEAAGEVYEVGQGVSRWKPGDRVSIDPTAPCGQCVTCSRGWQHLCPHMTVIGSSMRSFKHGAMCEYVALRESQLYRLPDNLSYAEGAMLDPVGNALHIFNRAPSEIGETVVIFGAGVIGLMAVQVAKLRGAGKVIAVDIAPSRLELARQLGADVLIHSGESDPVEVIRRETEGMGADVLAEAVGLPITYDWAVQAARPRGTVLALGFHVDYIPIPIQPLLFKEVTLIGNTGFSIEQQTSLDVMSAGKIDVKPIITHEMDLSDVQQAFDMLASGSSEAIKIVLAP